MSKKDQTESDWTKWFNERFGRGITRRNVVIGPPIIVSMTVPIKRYTDGTVHPPISAKEWGHTHPASEPLPNSDIPSHITSKEPFSCIDTNPNFKGDGYYFPEYQKHGVYYDYPEFTPKVQTRLKGPQQTREFSLEIRRRLY